jgi:predicted DNA binding protein
MTLRAEVRIGTPELLLGPTVKELPDLELRVEPQLTTDIVFFSVRSAEETDSLDQFETIVESTDTIEDFRPVVDKGKDRLYAVEVDLDRPLIEEVAADLGINVVTSESKPGDRDWTLVLDVPDRDALREFRTFCVDNDIRFDLRRLFYPEDSGGERDFGLSETQRETLLVAIENGYFEVPRRISQRELAVELDASPTAVSHRLRRAIATLVRNSIVVE